PNERILMHVVEALAPESDRKQLSRHAQSILGQILHYRVFRPFLERMSEGAVENPGEIDSISEHITRFSLRALGCTKGQIEEALAEAATSERI
ncbi:MAG: CerR family C-terminal domain-containing protein, partial [Planctomycetota bacterium]